MKILIIEGQGEGARGRGEGHRGAGIPSFHAYMQQEIHSNDEVRTIPT